MSVISFTSVISVTVFLLKCKGDNTLFPLMVNQDSKNRIPSNFVDNICTEELHFINIYFRTSFKSD